MERYDLYRDIATRTGGDIYVGVVGPVRSGKSTLIRKAMELLVLPAIEEGPARSRIVDELPQSGGGKTIMTTQPHFVPNEAAALDVGENIKAQVRMIDCVGYMVEGALGQSEGDAARQVMTPWSEQEMPFEEAAALGTRKVIEEHATIGMVVTTDGSITGIPREAYVPAEERVVEQLQQQQKPFVVVLNSTHPQEKATQELAQLLRARYDVPVLALDIASMGATDLQRIFESLLLEFPVRTLQLRMPDWVRALPAEHWLLDSIVGTLGEALSDCERMHDAQGLAALFSELEYADPLRLEEMALGEGNVDYYLPVKRQLFYQVMGESCGCEVENDFQMLYVMEDLMHAKREYARVQQALDSAERTGYGVVVPNMSETTLSPPELVRQGSRYGVRLSATAPSLHIMRVDVKTDVAPIVGSQVDSEELVSYLQSEYQSEGQEIWDVNFFGKTLSDLVRDGCESKITRMPIDAREKIQHTLTRIVNEGSGGLICILL